MSYDFAVLAAQPDLSNAAAQAAYERLCDATVGTPDTNVQEFLRDLLAVGDSDDDGWLSIAPEAGADGAIVCTTFKDISRNLRELLVLTARHSVALLDVQNGLLFNPVDSVPLRVESGVGIESPYVSRQLLDAVFSVLRGRYPWMLIERSPEVYVQVLKLAEGGYQVEHRAGSAADHFQSIIDDAEFAKELIWAWVTDQRTWETATAWNRLAL